MPPVSRQVLGTGLNCSEFSGHVDNRRARSPSAHAAALKLMPELVAQAVSVTAKIFRECGGGLPPPHFHQRIKEALRT